MKSSSAKHAALVLAMSTFLVQEPAFAQAPAAPHGHAAAGMQSASPGKGSTDLGAVIKDMNDKMSSMPMSGDTDMDFAMMMRAHHQGAIDMAQVELRDGKNPQMRKMANQIIAAQKKEIAEIDRFLAKHHQADGSMKK